MPRRHAIVLEALQVRRHRRSSSSSRPRSPPGSRAARRPRPAVGQARRPRGPGRLATRPVCRKSPTSTRTQANDLNAGGQRPPARAGGCPTLPGMPDVVDQVALARLYGEPLFAMPHDLYIPPDALEVFLEAFEGPLDLLLYLIRKQNFNILDIPMADVTRQYLVYVEEIRTPQPGAGRRIPADGGDADRDQVAHAAAAEEDGRGPGARRPARRTGAPPARIRADEAGRRPR